MEIANFLMWIGEVLMVTALVILAFNLLVLWIARRIEAHIEARLTEELGDIAQEIEEILPQIVTNRDNGYKAVKYEKIIPLLIEAIKELSAKVDELSK
mgnify:CR=1 FL=1